MNIPTPHIAADNTELIAKTVLMPGDPLRSKHIAEKFLENAVLVNNLRGVQGYTGYYKGKKITVMASGMGMPAIGIYSYELFNFYGAETIIRVGSAGAISPKLKLRDIVIGMAASTDSNYLSQFGLPGTYSPCADYETLSKAVNASEKLGIPVNVGNIISSDIYYDESNGLSEWRKMGVLAVEMEAAALYANAARCGKKALCICTVSNTPLGNSEECSALEREQSFDDMVKIALETACDE